MNQTFRIGTRAILLFLACTLPVHGAGKYAVSTIPAALRPADAVIREASYRLTVKNIKRSTYEVTYAVTIFSKSAQDCGELELAYGKYVSVDDLDGTIYDANGEEIRDLNKNDIKDESSGAGYSLADDARTRTATLIHDTFPYTVEFRYALKYNGSLHWPSWTAQASKHPVERTSFTVSIPKEYRLRTWCNRTGVAPVETDDGSDVVRVWSAHDLPALSDDEETESVYDITTVVKVAPFQFQLDDYEGSMESWKAFGAWYYQLYKDRQSLPADAESEVRTLVQAAQTEPEKIKILYQYMQAKTRYVSIQLGIGGWQPFEAAYVHARGYGDCKALSNYMATLLRTVGIRAYPVLINSGSNRISMITEFPSSQFDHVIVCVPQPKDTIWLECTSQSMPFGRLGYFTESRPALLVSDSGGTVVYTPASRPEQNLQRRMVKAELAASGTVTAEIETAVSGDQQVETQLELLHASPEHRQTWLMENLKTPNVSLSALSIEGLEDRSPDIRILMTATLGRYASLNTSRVFFNPSLLTKRTTVPKENRARKSPVRYTYPYVDIDSITIALPRQYTIETLPADAALHSSFGSFSTSTKAYGDTLLVYYRRTEVTTRSIGPERYAEYRTFYQSMEKADRAQVVLRLKK